MTLITGPTSSSASTSSMSPLSIVFAFSVFSGADYFDANNTFVQINNGDDFLDSISFVQGRVKRARD